MVKVFVYDATEINCLFHNRNRTFDVANFDGYVRKIFATVGPCATRLWRLIWVTL
jgi:hypothetical protein